MIDFSCCNDIFHHHHWHHEKNLIIDESVISYCMVERMEKEREGEKWNYDNNILITLSTSAPPSNRHRLIDKFFFCFVKHKRLRWNLRLENEQKFKDNIENQDFWFLLLFLFFYGFLDLCVNNRTNRYQEMKKKLLRKFIFFHWNTSYWWSHICISSLYEVHMRYTKKIHTRTRWMIIREKKKEHHPHHNHYH